MDDPTGYKLRFISVLLLRCADLIGWLKSHTDILMGNLWVIMVPGSFDMFGWVIIVLNWWIVMWKYVYKYKIPFLKRFYLFSREGKGGRERGRETSIFGHFLCAPHLGTWPPTQAVALDQELNWRPYDLQAGIQPLSHTSQGQTTLFWTWLFEVKIMRAWNI